MDRNTRVLLRLVNKALKRFIDEYMGIYVVINDNHQSKETLAFFSKVVIRKAVIENASMVQFSSLFKKPQYIDAIFLDGEIHAEFFTSILSCCPKLNILILLGEIIGVIPGIIADDFATFRKSLFNLKSIDIRIAYSMGGGASLPYEEAQQACFNMINFLNIFHAPKLETCCLDSWITKPFSQVQVAEVLLDFLEIHPNIKGLLVYFRMLEKDFEVQSPEDAKQEAKLLDENTDSLVVRLEKLGRTLQLSTCILSSVPYPSLWQNFLKGQTSLRTLSFCDKNCSWGPCEAPLKLNLDSLKVIYVLLDLKSQLDFSLFAKCRNLNELILINTATREIMPGVACDICNLDKMQLCENLQFCGFSNLIVNRQDLQHFAKMKSLSALALLSSGFGYDTGVNLELLQSLLEHRTLDAILIDGTVAVDEEEAEKIYQIIQTLAEAVDDDRTGRDVQTGVINIRPPFWAFHRWTPNPNGDNGFLFNMEFDHHHP